MTERTTLRQGTQAWERTYWETVKFLQDEDRRDWARNWERGDRIIALIGGNEGEAENVITRMAADTGLSRNSIRGYRRVAAAVPPEKRDSAVPWHVYRSWIPLGTPLIAVAADVYTQERAQDKANLRKRSPETLAKHAADQARQASHTPPREAPVAHTVLLADALAYWKDRRDNREGYQPLSGADISSDSIQRMVDICSEIATDCGSMRGIGKPRYPAERRPGARKPRQTAK